tara:strand:+ start:64588 stop:65142 length:555 start_codon:yes stop_codon:yes gene_type:complete
MDQSLFTWINSGMTNAFFDMFFPLITDLHKTKYFGLIVIPLCCFLLYKKYSKKGFLIFLFCLLSLGTIDLVGNHGFKKPFERMRPFENSNHVTIQRSPAAGFSFVSNHSANMFGFALFMGFFLPVFRKLFFTIAFLVAYSRVYNGVHYPSDVVVGALVGSIISFVFIKLYLRFFDRSKKEVATV